MKRRSFLQAVGVVLVTSTVKALPVKAALWHYPCVPNKRIIKAYRHRDYIHSGQLMLDQAKRYERYLKS